MGLSIVSGPGMNLASYILLQRKRLKSLKQFTKSDAGEVVENGKPSFTVHKNANQYDHSGKQYRDFSKTK